MLSVEDFNALTPYQRGYMVYMAVEFGGQPNIPNESNPYTYGSRDALDWVRGMISAVLETHDNKEQPHA